MLVFFALYSALKSISRIPMLVAMIFNTVFVAVDVAVDIPLRLLLIGLSNSYTTAQNGAQQTAYLVAAQSNIGASNMVALVATFFQFSAIILASYVMRKSSSFERGPSYVGITCGALALLFIPTFAAGSQLSGPFNIAGFVFLVIWCLISGNALRKLVRTSIRQPPIG